MPEAKNRKSPNVGALEKRRVKMADGRRYLIYYTFENGKSNGDPAENNLPESASENSSVEKEAIENV